MQRVFRVSYHADVAMSKPTNNAASFRRILGVLYVALLLCAAMLLSWPALPLSLIDIGQKILTRTPWRILASVPLFLYAALGFGIRGYLWSIPPDEEQMEGDKQQSASLTLSGFCFTSLSLLVSYFKDEIKSGDHRVEPIILFFCCAWLLSSRPI